MERQKAHLIIKDFTQKEGIECQKSFSLVSWKDFVGIIIALVTHFNLQLHQLNVKTTFLNSEIIIPFLWYNKKKLCQKTQRIWFINLRHSSMGAILVELCDFRCFMIYLHFLVILVHRYLRLFFAEIKFWFIHTLIFSMV